MSVRTEWVEWTHGGKRRRAYAARLSRAQLPLPAVIVVQEIWGVDDHIRDVTERFARAGYLAVAPDLYWENGGRPPVFEESRIEEVKAFLDTLAPAEWSVPERREAAADRLEEPARTRVKETLSALFAGPARDLEKHAATLQGLAAFLRDFEPCRGRPVASVGYCMGGALSALLACLEPDLAGAVVYYGRLPGEDRAREIRCPMLGFFAGEDPPITAMVPAFTEGMARMGKSWTYRIYEGAKHAFFNDTRSSYDVRASADAWARTLGFLRDVLYGGR